MALYAPWDVPGGGDPQPGVNWDLAWGECDSSPPRAQGVFEQDSQAHGGIGVSWAVPRDGLDHRIIEWIELEKTSEIIKSNP
ncbi:hypothetical protein WISP_149384 [Willisornis vidua]|uniref:Uncharacterized protein n=1 Tax=Willisornis vidua TaxID=1566151 RepID=A0ABQ9CK56_9PASS|nr:hypothetical protein WISP_149384 [Willisornis vidua]